MLVTCWSVKGGSGTTVVATALAVLLSRRHPGGALLVDAGGDVPTALGLPEPAGPGLFDWLTSPGVDSDALRRLEVAVSTELRVLPAGTPSPLASPESTAGTERLFQALAGRVAVIDAGPPSALAHELASGSTVSLLVLRPCYLALRKAMAAPLRPSAVVLVEEEKRSLDALDVEDVLGVPVRAVVPWHPAIARSVDAGLLGSRLPGMLAGALREAA